MLTAGMMDDLDDSDEWMIEQARNPNTETPERFCLSALCLTPNAEPFAKDVISQ